jgi:kynurenine formamidase
MMYSRWEHLLHTEKYLGLNGHIKHFPGISLEAIKFLISERDIAGVGVDVIAFDPGNDSNCKGHKLLLGANKWPLEAVANLN